MDLHSIYDCKNYQDYLGYALPTTGEERGIRSRLALYLDCRVSHLTQVIQKQNHLSYEMAYKIAEFLKLSEDETHFFLLLVSKSRSGNVKLEKYYHKQIDEILKTRSKIKERLQISDELTKDQVMHYYSSWYFSAIHILCSLPDVNTIHDLQKRLRLDYEQLNEAVEFLIDAGILQNTKEGLNTTNRRIHLDAKSKMISKHHTNWRVKAIDELSLPKEESLHFSSVYSFSKEDFIKIREIILKTLSASESLIKDSPEEMVATLCVDFFQVGATI
jgi:uncharacterized protein (TIGR02147 family)